MKKLFFLALMAFLWLPATTWADDHTEDPTGEHSGQIGDDEVWDDEQENDYGSIVPSDIQLTYKILSQPTGTYGNEGYEDGTVELEGVYSVPTGVTTYSISVPHEIQVVNINMTDFSATVALYTVVGIGASAFEHNDMLTSVTIPYTVTSIGNYAFDDCENLATLTFVDTQGTPSELKTIGTGAFMGAPIASLELPASVTSLGEKAFKDCSQITSLVVPASLTTISKNAFDNCGNLATVTLSGNTTLGEKAFGDCGKMTAVVFNDEAPEDINGGAEENADPFGGDETDEIIVYVPTGYAAVYASSGWDTLVGEEDELSWNFFSTNVSETGFDGEETYYATYYVDEEGYILEGATAYYVSGIEEGVTQETAIEGIIPEGTAILIGSSVAGNYYFYKEYESTKSVENIETNMLYGSNVAVTTSVNGVTEGYYFYKLSRNSEGDEGSVGFYWGASDGGAFNSAAYKAWLAVPQEEVDGLSQISFKKNDEGDTTGISAVESASEAKTVKGIYTLQGVRVSDMSQKGVYIVDGKKVLVK